MSLKSRVFGRWWSLCRWLVFSAGVLTVLGACAVLRTPQVPMPFISDRLESAVPVSERALIVFLPGSQEVPQDLIDEGFVEQVRSREIVADIVIADAAPRHYTSGLFEERLRLDVIEPAMAQGYKEIWLAGISIGGFGTLLYSSLHSEKISGAIALAPFVASDHVLDEVTEAGGLRSWEVTPEPQDWQRNLLAWLKRYGDTDAQLPKLYVGFGIDDGYDEMAQVFDGVLPGAQFRSAPGDHDWPPWKQLWGEFLDAAPLPRLKLESH